MAHYMAIRVKCSIMIILNAPYGEGEVSLNNPAYFSIFNFQFSIFNSLDDEALGRGGVGGAEGDEVGAGGVLGK